MTEKFDPRPDPATYTSADTAGMTSEQRIAYLEALQERSREIAAAERGRPLRPGDISETKGRFPVVTRLVGRRREDGTWEDLENPSRPADTDPP